MSTTEQETVELRDGSRVVIRPIRPSDKAAVVEGFKHLSPESRYKRFLSPVTELKPRELRYFTEVDHHDHEALIAFSLDQEPLGVARYVRADEHTAEAAVAVVDHWQGRGLGTALLKQLAMRAREEGIDGFTATLLASNREMIWLLEELGPPQVRNVGDGICEARVELPLTVEPGTPLHTALRGAAAGGLEQRPDRVLPGR